MGNQYGYTGLTPALALGREAYRKGLRSGREAKVYDKHKMFAALQRFKVRYGNHAQLVTAWLDGWHDAKIYRDVKVIACERE